jgi:FkbM family methyltransferase
MCSAEVLPLKGPGDRLRELLRAEAFPSEAKSLEERLGGKNVIVYGAGDCFHWFHEIAIKRYGLRPKAILDRSFRGGELFEGIPAFPPEAYTPTAAERENSVVVVCVGKQRHHPEILACLREKGFTDILLLRDLYEIHNPFRQPEALEEEGFAYYRARQEAILQGLACFEDALSREVYRSFLETHLRRVPVPLPESPLEEQYFPRDVPLGKGCRRFVSCGAYDGETVRRVHALYGRVGAIACFEPEPAIFHRLAAYLGSARRDLADWVIAFPCAAYSRDELLPFLNAEGLGSRISPEGGSRVQAVSLDHVLPSFGPTYLTMDAEGAELEILRGAERTLREHRPDLAVCVYHAPNHAWEIPLFLEGLGLGYRFYLRNYTSFALETVLYATVPGEGSGLA